MKIGFCFYGITYGLGGRTGSSRDFRHCWPNIKKMLIDPLVAQGHEAKIYFSTYFFEDKEIEKEFYEMVKPDDVFFSSMQGSDPFTAKFASFNVIQDKDVDVIILSRCDVHYSKILANENINFEKFNFLFPEKDWWNTEYKFTCDNFYVWPHHMSQEIVRRAMFATYTWPRGKPFVDTHGLMVKLLEHISPGEINLISDVEELSDVNSFYTCCRNGLPKRDCIHSEVEERYKKENWKYYE